MKKSVLTILLFSLILAISAFPVKITSWDINPDIKKLNALQISVDYVNRDTGTIIAYVPNDADYQKLLANGFNAEPIPDLAKLTAEAERQAADGRDGPNRSYYTLDAYHTFMQNMVTQYPTLCQLVQFGTSVQNRPMYFLKISDNVTQEENEPEFRYSSSIHGDEVVGFDLCIRLIQLLTSQYATNTRIANIVNNTEIWICPMYNPDGYIAAARYNANGADLNRNYPLPVGTQHPDGMAWQPETIAFMNFGNEHSINLSANYHGGTLVANYPWDYIYPLCPDNDLFIQAALTYANTNLPMHNSTEFNQGITNGAAWYIAEGTLQDWVYSYNDCMDITIEVSNNKWPPSSQLDTFWSENQESMLAYLEFVQKGVHGTVTNPQGTPLAATISLVQDGINIQTDPQVGDYHRMLLPGQYSITASAAGYTSATETVVVPVIGSATQNFVLSNVVLTNFTGYVTNLQGIPIPDAELKLTMSTAEFQTQTDTQGHFSLSNIPSDNYTLDVSAAGYGLYSSAYHLDSNSNHQIVVLPNPLFSDNFENGLTNWTVTAPWGIITQAANHVLTDSPTGDYSDNTFISATLNNLVSLVDLTNPVLTFDISYSLESGYDFLNVQASTNGINWNNLDQLSGTQTEWQTLTYHLTQYIGSAIYLRFQLDSDFSETADGVYIDNVMISGMSTLQTVYGDTDANWLVNMLDVENVLQYSVGNDPIPALDSTPWETFRLEAADVDNDVTVTATDAFYIYDKWNIYNSAFPAQGEAAYTFGNPNLSFQSLAGLIRVMADNPENLKSLTLSFSSATNLSIESVAWQPTDEQTLKAGSIDNKSIGLIKLQNAVLPSLIAQLDYATLDNVIHCSGLVNDIPVSFDIQTVANQDPQSVPLVTNLAGNYPNPFSSETRLSFTLAKSDNPVSLCIYNVKGQSVKTLLSGKAKSGLNQIIWNGTDNQNHQLANGIYYCRLQTTDKTITRKLVMLR